MSSVPEGSMLSKGGIRVCLELSLECGVMVWRNGGLKTRRRGRPKVEAVSLLSNPAFERAEADGKGGHNLLS
jgi:hypothetical protein